MRTAKVLAAMVVIAGVSLAAIAVKPSAAQQSSAMQQVGMVRTGSGTFSLDVEGADIRTVLRAISEFSGRNIVIGNTVKGTVKCSIKNVGWQEAMRTVLRMNDLDYVDEGGILRVDDATKLATEQVARETANAKTAEVSPLETRIVRLNYANAAEMQTSLQSSLSKRGSIQTEKRSNSMIVTDLAASLDRIEKMAADLDGTTPQIEITAKLVDVDVSALRDIGVEWNVGSPLDGPKFTRGVADPAHPSAGDKLDGGGPYVGNVHNNDGSVQGGAEQSTSIGDAANKLTFGIFKNWASIEAQIQTLEENRKANIISNPRITTVDNREAKILVGQKIPLIVQDVAGNPVSQLQTIGIMLRVTPHLTQDKRIIMDLHPEVSDLSTQSTVQGGVIINTSEADTRVMVDDGQTAVIGGLIRTNDSHVRSGVPLLKDIPLLGMLFRSDSVVRQNRELIIFVTPRLVNAVASN